MTNPLDELFSENEVEDSFETENNMSSKERRKKKWEEFKKSYDWEQLPLHILIIIILIIGAILMGISIYMLTENLLVAILSPAFTELGLSAAHFAGNRAKNSVRQKEIATRLRNWHIFTSVTLLVSNLLVETATSMLDGFKIDGIIYLIFGIVGLTSLIDILSYFNFRDHDDEWKRKNKFAKDIENIKANVIQGKMDAYEQAEKVYAEELKKTWLEVSPEKARRKARIEAAQDIKKMYEKFGIDETEVDKLLGEETETDDDDKTGENNSGKRPYKKTGQYSKKNQLTPPQQEQPESFPIGETQPQPVVDEEKMNRMKDAKIFN